MIDRGLGLLGLGVANSNQMQFLQRQLNPPVDTALRILAEQEFVSIPYQGAADRPVLKNGPTLIDKRGGRVGQKQMDTIANREAFRPFYR